MKKADILIESNRLVQVVPLEGKRAELKEFTLRVAKDIIQVDGLAELHVNENEETGALYLYYVWEDREKEEAYMQSDLYKRVMGELENYIKKKEKTFTPLVHIF